MSKRNAGRWVGLWTKWHLATFVYAVRRTEQICGDGERFVNFCDFQHNIPVYLRAKTYCTLAGPLKKGAAAGRGVLVRTLCQADMVPELPHAVGECSSVSLQPPPPFAAISFLKVTEADTKVPSAKEIWTVP